MTREKPGIFSSENTLRTKIHDLVVHNDDFNTFDFVIQTLIEVCAHKPEQAEQCTMIIHYKGKCVVRSGELDLLEPMYLEILRRGITATIEE